MDCTSCWDILAIVPLVVFLILARHRLVEPKNVMTTTEWCQRLKKLNCTETQKPITKNLERNGD